MLKVAVTPAFEKSTKTGIKLSLEFPSISKHTPPRKETKNQNTRVVLSPIFLYMNPLIMIAGSSLIEDENVLRKIFPLMFFI